MNKQQLILAIANDLADRVKDDKQPFAYDRAPVQLKVLPNVRERLMEIDGWQAQVRKAIDRLIQKDKSSGQERIRAEIDLLIQEDESKKA